MSTSRKIPLVTNEIYHVFNRSIAKTSIFNNEEESNRFLELIDYYRFSNNPLKFSYYCRLNPKQKIKYLDSLYSSQMQVEIYSFCVMPNHFHLLIKQKLDNGICNFMSLIQNSYAKYLNLKTTRYGSLFISPFKAVGIETEEQLVHVLRYIHLNPLTSYLLQKPEELEEYKYTSHIDYIKKARPFINTEYIGQMFNNKTEYKEFTYNQVEYQRDLEKIKDLI